MQAWPELLRNEIARLAETEYRLRNVAASLCPNRSATAGFALDSLDAYAEADQNDLRRVFAMGSRPQVAAVASGSPAEKAGIQAGDELAAIDGTPVEQLAEQGPDRALLADIVQNRIASTPADAGIRLTLVRNGRAIEVDLRPQQACSARLVLKADTAVDAFSDDDNVAVTLGLLSFTRNDDELALVAGHELAHIIARDAERHRKRETRTIAQRQATEDRADLLGAELAHCAGYDVMLSLGFWERYRQRDWLGFLRNPTHRSAKSRMRSIAEAAPSLSCPPGIAARSVQPVSSTAISRQ